MHIPLVSVLMPVYNLGNYLKEGIESILNQTFTDFEVIIVNDGSTDNSEEIILSYNDSRIQYYKNDINQGLIYSLNRALSLCNGKYIARMDGDDVSLLHRFEVQVKYLVEHPEVDAVASTVKLIDEEGNHIGFWKDDKNHITRRSIKSFQAKNNCIAHPTVMIRTEVLKKYRYNVKQKLSEDYDLWLRMIADGRIIDKIAEPLLLHRILQTSFTRTRKVNVFYKLMQVKQEFVKDSFKQGRVNTFILKTSLYSLLDGVKGLGKYVKQKLLK